MLGGVLALLLAAAATAADHVDANIDVLGQTPAQVMRLRAAVEAALAAEGETARAAEPFGEPQAALALAARACGAGERGAAAAVAGAAGARLAGAGAARAAAPLLLVEAAPLAADWEALAMFPHADVLARAGAALARDKGWQHAVLLHEGGAAAAAALTREAEPAPLALLARRLPPAADQPALRDLLLVLKKSGKTKFIVWCEAECAHRVLLAAQRAGLLAERHAYLVLALDLHTRPLDRFSHGGANITGVRMFDPESAAVRACMERWRDAYLQLRLAGERAPADAEREAALVQAAPPTALLLAYQAALLVRQALTELRLAPARPADCARGRGAFHADTLLNYLRSNDWESELSGGVISWDVDGGRRSVKLEVVELVRGGRLQHAGVWAPHAPLVWERSDPPAPAPPLDFMTNLTFNVLIAMNSPYVMRKQSTSQLSGNDRYEGFCIELIEKLAEILKFNYTFVEQLDQKYGSYRNETDSWDGMIGRIMDPQDDMHFALTDLTIMAERERAVDFTTPFMNLGISILFRKASKPTPELFAFLLPFSSGVWLCLALAYLGTSLLLYVVGRLCHEEWQNPHPCVEEPAALQNQFTLANALWFNLGAVLLQGSEIAPVAYGSRAVASVWWLFALVITSSYTANLATLLAKKSTNDLIRSVDDLAHNHLGILYGAKETGSTFTFFQQSQDKLYHEMYEHMIKNPLPKSNPEGVDWVAKNDSTYAFLMESTTIEYEVERNCNVSKVGELLDSKGYGIAMRKGSPYRQSLNVALLKLQEAGELRRMKRSWWIEKNGGGACQQEEEYASEELGWANFRGLFLVLAVGCAFGVLLSCLDLAAASRRRARTAGEPTARRFWRELRFVLRFNESVKPIAARGEGESSGSESPPPAEEGAGGESRAASRRRRSSMHAASVRLARHAAAARDSATPAPAPDRRRTRAATRDSATPAPAPDRRRTRAATRDSATPAPAPTPGRRHTRAD